MLRALLVGFGLLELLFPKQVVDIGIRLAFDTEGDVEPKPWVYTVARIEGAVFVLLALWKLGGSSKDVEADAAE